MAQDPRKFLFSSDYPMPVIVYKLTGNVTVTPSDINKTVTVKHNLGFKPLIMGVWSLASNFTPSQDIANTDDWTSLVSGDNTEMISCYVSSDATNVYIEAQNLSLNNKTFYWRLFAYAPPGYTGETPVVADTTNFSFSSEFNYQKLAMSGDTGTIAYGSSSTIAHNLGYVPQVRVWQEENGKVTPSRYVFSYNISGYRGGPRITSSNLVITNLDVIDAQEETAKKYYYHIYGDAS